MTTVEQVALHDQLAAEIKHNAEVEKKEAEITRENETRIEAEAEFHPFAHQLLQAQVNEEIETVVPTTPVVSTEGVPQTVPQVSIELPQVSIASTPAANEAKIQQTIHHEVNYLEKKADQSLDKVEQKMDDAKSTLEHDGGYVDRKAEETKESIDTAAENAQVIAEHDADYLARKAAETATFVQHEVQYLAKQADAATDFAAQQLQAAKETAEHEVDYIARQAENAKEYLAEQTTAIKETLDHEAHIIAKQVEDARRAVVALVTPPEEIPLGATVETKSTVVVAPDALPVVVSVDPPVATVTATATTTN